MKLYVIMRSPPARQAVPDHFSWQAVPDHFSWPAFVLGPVWFFWHGLPRLGILSLFILLAGNWLLGDFSYRALAFNMPLALFWGVSGQALRRLELARMGYHMHTALFAASPYHALALTGSLTGQLNAPQPDTSQPDTPAETL